MLLASFFLLSNLCVQFNMLRGGMSDRLLKLSPHTLAKLNIELKTQERKYIETLQALGAFPSIDNRPIVYLILFLFARLFFR